MISTSLLASLLWSFFFEFVYATITSYGQAVTAQDDTQRSYTFPNAKPAEAVEYVLGAAKDKVVQDNFFRPGAHAP